MQILRRMRNPKLYKANFSSVLHAYAEHVKETGRGNRIAELRLVHAYYCYHYFNIQAYFLAWVYTVCANVKMTLSSYSSLLDVWVEKVVLFLIEKTLAMFSYGLNSAWLVTVATSHSSTFAIGHMSIWANHLSLMIAFVFMNARMTKNEWRDKPRPLLEVYGYLGKSGWRKSLPRNCNYVTAVTNDSLGSSSTLLHVQYF